MVQELRAPAATRRPGAPAVELRGVGVWRRADGGRRHLLREIDWRVEPGEHWGIVGPNGSGKTTLLRVVSAQMRPTLGEAHVLGGRFGAVSLPELRRRIGFVEQSFGRRFYPEQTVAEVVLTGLAGTILLVDEVDAAARAKARRLLDLVGAAPLAGRTFASCSEGERARVLLARALATDAELLILDEPAAGLDVAGRELLLDVFADVVAERPGLTTLTVSHHLEELPSTTTHLLLLREAALVAAGPIEETATDELLSTCFGVPLRATRSDGRVFVSASRRRPTERRDRRG